jgi:pimeloyl-ACP methyl ester carboxylesterase
MFASPLFKSSKYLLASLALALAAFGAPTVQAAGPTGVKNVLLVHGAWADGSSWTKVINKLHADGYNVTAVQLQEMPASILKIVL